MDSIFSFLGWTFLPGYATSILQSVYYKLTVPIGRIPPQPGNPVYIRHQRRIRMIVLILYLVYTVLQSLYDIRLAGDFFTVLSLTPGSTDGEIKSRFRRLAAKFHPDKLRALDNNDQIQQDTHFLLLKTAQDTLLSPPLRYAYTRFGPSITRLQSPSTPTIRAYVLAGLRDHLLPSYLMNIGTLIGLNFLFLPKWGSYWRYLILSATVLIEMYILTHSERELQNIIPSFVPIGPIYTFLQTKTKLGQILPPHLLPYQTLTIIRKMSISLNIFISQLAPVLSSPTANVNAPGAVVPVLSKVNQSLNHLQQIALRTDAESTSLLHLQMAPFKGDETSTRNLREGMKEGMITGAVRQHPEVREAVQSVIERKKGSTDANSAVGG